MYLSGQVKFSVSWFNVLDHIPGGRLLVQSGLGIKYSLMVVAHWEVRVCSLECAGMAEQSISLEQYQVNEWP